MNTPLSNEDAGHLRMAFAAMAMSALIPSIPWVGDSESYANTAAHAVKYADALIAALAIPSAPQ